MSMKTQFPRKVAKNVGLSLVVYLVALFCLMNIPSTGGIWDGVLFFGFVELLLFFVISFIVLVLIKQRWPNSAAEAIYLRLVITIASTVAMGALVTFMSREFAQYLLVIYAICMFAWAIFKRMLKAAFVCLLLIFGLLLVPVDVKFSLKTGEAAVDDQHVKLLSVIYGLVDHPEPGTYPMGCVVPPYPIKWMLRINF